jgi:hypothetical protein
VRVNLRELEDALVHARVIESARVCDHLSVCVCAGIRFSVFFWGGGCVRACVLFMRACA